MAGRRPVGVLDWQKKSFNFFGGFRRFWGEVAVHRAGMWAGAMHAGVRERRRLLRGADTTIFVGKIASSVRGETVEALVRACGELKVRA